MSKYQQELDKTKDHLFHIQADLKWTFVEGFYPRGSKSSEGKSGALVSDNNEPKSGNPKARLAYRNGAKLLYRSDVNLAQLLYRVYHLKHQPALLKPKDNLPQSLKTVESIRWRLDQLPELSNLTSVEIAFGLIYDARMALHSGLSDKSKSGVEPTRAIPFCSQCQIREIKTKGKCHTCYVYEMRTGKPRPKSLDKGSRPYDEAMAARERHGVGFGFK